MIKLKNTHDQKNMPYYKNIDIDNIILLSVYFYIYADVVDKHYKFDLFWCDDLFSKTNIDI